MKTTNNIIVNSLVLKLMLNFLKRGLVDSMDIDIFSFPEGEMNLIN